MAAAGARLIIHSQLFVTPPTPTASFTDKYVIVTGGNRGIGLEAARHFIRLGAAKVILGVRTLSAGEAAKDDLVASQGCDPSIIDVWHIDLASFDSVKDFAKRINTLPRLDVLICGSGTVRLKFELLPTGHETQVTIMVISTLLLAFLALPKMKATASTHQTTPHISLVTSDMHYFTDLPERKLPEPIFESLRDRKHGTKFRMYDRYSICKMILIMVIRELFREDAGIIKDKAAYPVVINAPNPGLCKTGFGAELGLPIKINKLLVGRKVEVGARLYVHAAVAGHESKGHYLHDTLVGKEAPFLNTAEGLKTQKRVWEELRAILEEIEPGVTGLI